MRYFLFLLLTFPLFGADEKNIDPANGLIKDENIYLVVGLCTGCHSSKIITQNRGNEDRWQEIIAWMLKEQGMPELDPEMKKKIIHYLAKNYGPESSGRRKPLPAHLLPPPQKE